MAAAGAHSEPPDPAAHQQYRAANAAARRRRLDLARDMWRSAVPARSTLVERYFRSRRITSPAPVSVRFIGPHTVYSWHGPSGERRPVMVAAVEHVEHGFVGVSRTFLAIDGSGRASLAPPRLFTGAVAGGAVRLAPAAETLMVGEGIETTLAAIQATAVPGWAALSTSGMTALVLPPIVQKVIILADHDLSGAGERVAQIAAARWLAEGRRVRIALPPEPGTDFADVLAGRSSARIVEAHNVAA
jgi:putative DNA primase/helicase